MVTDVLKLGHSSGLHSEILHTQDKKTYLQERALQELVYLLSVCAILMSGSCSEMQSLTGHADSMWSIPLYYTSLDTESAREVRYVEYLIW